MRECLHGVGVERHAVGLRDGRQLCDGFDGAYFVVREHDGRQDGVFADGCFEAGGGDEALSVNGQVGDFEPVALQRLEGVQHGMVFDGAGD